MESAPSSLDTNMLIAAGLLVLAYILIFSEVIHRTTAAIVGVGCVSARVVWGPWRVTSRTVVA